MAVFNRTLIETGATIGDFLLAGSSLGLGTPINQSIFLNTNLLGDQTNQAAQFIDIFGDSNDFFPIIQLFTPVGVEQTQKSQGFETGIGETSQQKAQGFEEGEGENFNRRIGLDVDRPIAETIVMGSSVDLDGDFTRDLIEIQDIFGRVGQSKGLFFHDEPSTIVTLNDEVRLLEDVYDVGEIAVSERPLSGDLKFLRYVPGTTMASPNAVDLGALPTDVGSQGFIFDDSPNGVLLRGEWEVKLLMQDTNSTGQIKLHVNLFTVRATVTGVEKVLKIGVTKSTSAFVPPIAATQYTFLWSQADAGETFIDVDEYLYVEVIVEEIAHPTTVVGNSRMRLDDGTATLFSQMRYPGVTDEPTFTRDVPAETITLSDAVATIIGYNEGLSESLTFSDSVNRALDFSRSLIETMTIEDFQVLGKVNVLFETLVFSDALTKEQVLIREFTENIPITDALNISGSRTQNLSERLIIRDTLSGFIRRPLREPLTDGINKRVTDGLMSERYRIREN